MLSDPFILFTLHLDFITGEVKRPFSFWTPERSFVTLVFISLFFSFDDEEEGIECW